MKKVILFILCLSASSFAVAVEIMHFSANCSVKKLGAAARGLNISVGMPAKLETTTNQDYKLPKEVIGKNSLQIGKLIYEGTAGRFSYNQESPHGNIFEILGGPRKVVMKQSSPSAFTGKFSTIVEIDEKKIVELVCIEPNN